MSRVLIVERDAPGRTMMERVLEAASIPADSVGSSRDAESGLDRGTYSVALVDELAGNGSLLDEVRLVRPVRSPWAGRGQTEKFSFTPWASVAVGCTCVARASACSRPRSATTDPEAFRGCSKRSVQRGSKWGKLSSVDRARVTLPPRRLNTRASDR